MRKSLYNLLLTLPLAGLILFSGCEEDPSQIGAGILPGTDLSVVRAIDTFSISTYTSYLDEIKSYALDANGSVIKPQYYYIGSLYSPYVGLTKAGFVTQMWLPYEWPRDHVTLDSAILNLHISGVAGDEPIPQAVKIYEIDEYLYNDSTYYINHNIQLKQYLGSFALEGLQNKDTILSVRLPMSMVNELMRDTTKIFLDETEDDFRTYFKGLYFEYIQLDNNHMVKVNLNGGFSSLYVYYTDTLDNVDWYPFLFNSKTVSFNVFEHDFSAAEPDKEIQNINQEIQDTVSYIQGYNGLFTTLRMPTLEALKDSLPLGINKARLILPVYTDEEDFPEGNFPARLIARYKDENGDRYSTRDYQLDPSFADGQYYSLDDYYLINITGFVQDYLEGVIAEPELEIVFSTYEGSQLIMWSRDSDNPPVLEVVYTKL